MADFEYSGSVIEEEEVKEPSLYRVVLLNDDFTPQDFVVEILSSIFHKQPLEATQIMMDVHKKGKGIVGIYPYDIGATKVYQVTKLSRERGFPLKSVLEKV
jgi:ATP-dependent Clp protease adaptor protein ClpS